MLHLLETGVKFFAIEGSLFDASMERFSKGLTRVERQVCKIETSLISAAITNTLSARELSYMGISSVEAQDGLIAIIEIRGATQMYSDDYCYGTEYMCKQIEIADGNVAVKAIILVADSQGGELSGAQRFAMSVRNAKKPVVGFARRKAASAAYWPLSQCKEIYIEDELTGLGSIGTMAIIGERSKALVDAGLNYVVLRSSGSEDKNPLNGFESFEGDIQKAALAEEQKLLTSARVGFLSDVRTVRPNISATIGGGMFYGKEAIKQNLADGFLDMAGVMKRANVLGSLARKA
jgi:ClpP class serine protease